MFKNYIEEISGKKVSILPYFYIIHIPIQVVGTYYIIATASYTIQFNNTWISCRRCRYKSVILWFSINFWIKFNVYVPSYLNGENNEFLKFCRQQVMRTCVVVYSLFTHRWATVKTYVIILDNIMLCFRVDIFQISYVHVMLEVYIYLHVL